MFVPLQVSEFNAQVASNRACTALKIEKLKLDVNDEVSDVFEGSRIRRCVCRGDVKINCLEGRRMSYTIAANPTLHFADF